jgi:hypothetical protein
MANEAGNERPAVVVLSAATWAHIVSEHPDMARFLTGIMLTAVAPEIALDDPRPGRKRHFRAGLGPSRWLRVVVDFNNRPPRIVTAHGYRKEHPK